MYHQFERKERRRRRSALAMAILIHLALFAGIYYYSSSEGDRSLPGYIKEWVKEWRGEEEAVPLARPGQA
jgi:hypothetical protein